MSVVLNFLFDYDQLPVLLTGGVTLKRCSGLLTRCGGARRRGRGEPSERRSDAVSVGEASEAREAGAVPETRERRRSGGDAAAAAWRRRQRKTFKPFKGSAALDLEGEETVRGDGPSSRQTCAFTSPVFLRLAFLIGRLFNTSSLATRNVPAFRKETHALTRHQQPHVALSCDL